MIPYAEFLAANPIPTGGVIFAKARAPHGFVPTLCVRRHKLEDGAGIRTYTARAADKVKSEDFRAKYIAALSKTAWRTSTEIATALGVSNVSVTKVMSRDYMKPLVACKMQKCIGGKRFIWRLK